MIQDPRNQYSHAQERERERVRASGGEPPELYSCYHQSIPNSPNSGKFKFLFTLSKIQARGAGFTLLELLIVIAVLAVLSGVTILVLNPVDILKRTRDARRLDDLAKINRGLGYFQTEGGTQMGSSSVVYISLPDTDDTLPAECDEYTSSLPSLPTGWSYACALKSKFRKTDGSGWIPVNFSSLTIKAPFSAIPIDPENNTSYYYSYITGGSWKVMGLLESERYIREAAQKDGGTSDAAYEVGTNITTLAPGIFPGGWARLPNGILVMQYEAKYDKNGDGDGDNASSANCVADLGDGLDWRDAGCSTASNIVSTANGSPIVHISHDQAKSACAAIGSRLINNQEWMSIARDAEQQGQNWSSGTVGTGCLFRGNVGEDDSCGYNGAEPEKGTSRNPKAILTLSNGAKIYDLAGNVDEHVMKDANDTLVNNHPTDGGAAGWRWIEHTAITGYGDLSYDEIRPSNSSWNATQGMGLVYT